MTLRLVAHNPDVPAASHAERAIRRLKFADASLVVEARKGNVAAEALHCFLDATIAFLQGWERSNR